MTPVKVAIVIKALNEERNIERAVRSALSASAQHPVEVILADSLSTDRTVDIASRFPIRIVQLRHAQERCCGIGPQLGYQHSRGEYVYILDGDMQMRPGFLDAAVAFLDAHPEVAGVGGQVVENNTSGMEYVARVERSGEHMSSGEVDRLDMGGLYRRAAIESVGYFSNRNLHSYEEFELGVRLRAKGWKLWRLDVPSVDHWGHDVPAYELLRKRWRSNYILGVGEVLRASLGQPHFRRTLAELGELKVYAIFILWVLLLLSAPFWSLQGGARVVAFAIAMVALPLLLFLRKRSLSKAAYSFVSGLYNVGGLLRGLARAPTDAKAPVASVVLKDV